MEKIETKSVSRMDSYNSSKNSNKNVIKNEMSQINKSSSHNERSCSSFGAYFNIVCVVGGTGTLGLPDAVKTGGWLSLFLIFISGFIAYTSGNMVIQCLYHKSNGKPLENNDHSSTSRLSSMADMGDAAFGLFGRYFVMAFNFAIMLGFSCLYIILIGTNMHSLAQQFFNTAIDLKYFIIAGGLLVLIPYILFKNLKEVAILAIFGALATLVVIVVAVVVGFIDLQNNLDKGHEIINLRGVPMALSTISFSFGANVVYPHVEGSMKTPNSWKKVLACAMITVTSAYLLIGVVGYEVYGLSVQSPILKSLPKGIPYVIATILITLHVILAAPIFLCSFSLEVEKLFQTEKYSKIKELLFRLLTRTLTIIILIIVAMIIPFFDHFMALVGALCNGFIIFIIPPFCHLKLFGFKNRSLYSYFWIAFILFIGLVCCILGVFDSISALVNDFNGKPSTGSSHI